MSQLQPPKTPVKQKFQKSFNQLNSIDDDMEDICDISPTLKTKRGRASLGSQFPVLNVNHASTSIASSNSESGATNLGLSSNDPGSVQSSELLSDIHEPRVSLFYRINPSMDGNKQMEENVTIFDFNSPNASPTKHGNAAERFVLLAADEEV